MTGRGASMEHLKWRCLPLSKAFSHNCRCSVPIRLHLTYIRLYLWLAMPVHLLAARSSDQAPMSFSVFGSLSRLYNGVEVIGIPKTPPVLRSWMPAQTSPTSPFIPAIPVHFNRFRAGGLLAFLSFGSKNYSISERLTSDSTSWSSADTPEVAGSQKQKG